jgi:hypothetical protein
MKQRLYNSKHCFTEETVVCTECTCPVGSRKNSKEKIMCVHQPPIQWRLEIHLYEYLANHALYELAAERAMFDKELSPDLKKGFSESLCILQRVACLIDDEVPHNLSGFEPSAILFPYTVATENAKPSPKLPDPKKLGPLREMRFVSDIVKAEAQMSGGASIQQQSTGAMTAYSINYVAIWDLVQTIRICVPVKPKTTERNYRKCIGFQCAEWIVIMLTQRDVTFES